MNKKTFLSLFSGIDEFLIASLFDDISLCETIDYPIETKIFYPPSVWKILEMRHIFSNLSFICKGLNNYSERKNIIIFPKDFEKEDMVSSIIYFKIDCTNKFKTLEHKDFLGTIMSLGFKRDYLGDLIIKDNVCYSITTKEFFKIISDNISHINKIPVSISEVTSLEIPEFNFKEIINTISSLRLDSIVSACIPTLSRNEATLLIEKGDILVNYITIKDKSFNIKEKDIISIKKYGKYIFEQTLNITKKDKIKILLKKYI